MVSKGFLKPDDICKVDYEGKQLAGTRKRTSEVLLHLAVYKNRPDVHAVVHCHPPHATAFAVAHEPIPKCVLPEVEVFLGEVPIAKYETPGDQKFADTIVPYVKDCNTIILANHGTVSLRPRPGEGLLEHRDHRRLLQDPDPGPATRPGQLLHRAADAGAAGPEEAARLRRRPLPQGRTATMCGHSSFDESYTDFVPRAARLCPRSLSVRTAAGNASGAIDTGRAGADHHRSGHGGAGWRGRVTRCGEPCRCRRFADKVE